MDWGDLQSILLLCCFFFELMNLYQKLRFIISKISFLFQKKKSKEEKCFSEIGFSTLSRREKKVLLNKLVFDRICLDDPIVNVFAKYVDFDEPRINGRFFVVLVKVPLAADQLDEGVDERMCYFAEVFYFRDSIQDNDKFFHGVININNLRGIMDAVTDLKTLYAIALGDYATSLSALKSGFAFNNPA